MCTKIKVITYGQQILHAASVGNLVFLSMRNSCQLVVAAIALDADYRIISQGGWGVYCGWDNELEKCDRCGQLVDVDVLENGLCPSCSAYIDKQ